MRYQVVPVGCMTLGLNAEGRPGMAGQEYPAVGELLLRLDTANTCIKLSIPCDEEATASKGHVRTADAGALGDQQS